MKWQIIWLIPAIGCVLYGFLIFSLQSGTSFFAVWMALGGLFFFLAAAVQLRLWQRIPVGGKAVCLIVLTVCLALFVFAEAKIVGSFGEKGEPGLDYLIVLGAQMRESGPSVVLQYRLDTACAYLEENPATICIVSGGQGPNEPCTEAEGMRTYLLEKGVSEERILVETESENTQENIRNSMRMLDPESDRVGIVTNNFHLYRGCAIAEKSGIRYVTGIAAPSKVLYLPNNMLRECLGVAKDALKRNL